MNVDKHKNILINQIFIKNDKTTFKEITPKFLDKSSAPKILGLDKNLNLVWHSYIDLEEGKNVKISLTPLGKLKIDVSINVPDILDIAIIKDNKIIGTEIYNFDNRVGIGRKPLLSYKFDIAVPKNTLLTAFHVGDGSYGFSMGNGTWEGFVPEIIGMGSSEKDAGLYFLGKAGNNRSSDVPLIILDGRGVDNFPLKNRPILGITSANYNDYKLIIDQNGRIGVGKIPEIYIMEIAGVINAEDFIIEDLGLKTLIDMVREQRREIELLKRKIREIQAKLN